MTTILGLDISLNTGYAIISLVRGGEPYLIESGVIKSPVQNKSMDRFIRYSDIATRLLNVMGDKHFDAIFIEGYSFNSKFNTVTMAEIGAIIRYFLWQGDNPVEVIEVAPPSLKAFVTGKGNAKKEMMLKEVFKKWGFDAATNDEADAIGLAMFGMAWHDVIIDFPKKNMEAVVRAKKALEVVKNPKSKK